MVASGSEIVNTICPPATPGVPYWYDPRIHVFGNVGLSGFFHAFSAPLATAIIDKLSYGGLDVRKLSHQLIDPVGEKSVLDMACGVGFSTMPGAHAIDTSNEMLTIARWRRPDVNFRFGNAETYGEDASYDVVTAMFAFHEMPQAARRRVLRNMMRVARETVVIVDIHPDFQRTLVKKPQMGASFLRGEPYVLDYIAKMDSDVFQTAQVHMPWAPEGWKARRITLLKGHVVMYRLDRNLPMKAPVDGNINAHLYGI